jgi:hypothetical protein
MLLFDIAAHSTEFGLADTLAIDEGFHGFDLNDTQEPAVVLRESGDSRTAWLAGDVERTFWLTGHGDLLRLLHNTIRWLTHNESPVTVDGPGFLEIFCWETRPGYAIHLLNYSNANAFHGWLQSVDPIGEQRIAIKLPAGVGVKSVELLKAADC